MIACLLIGPYIVWRFIPQKPFQVTILDKTVPVNSYREHKALVWLLNNLRYVNKETGRPFAFDKDYYGFFPLPDQKYEIRPLPAELNKSGLIYVADTYGVYTADFYKDNLRGERSRLIYGGMTATEAAAIGHSLTGKNTLVAEFNSLASPTSGRARELMEGILAVKWTGWIARYFEELSDKKNTELPVWMISNYKKQYGVPWAFEGPGFVFVNKDDSLLVLRAGAEVGPKLNRLFFTPAALAEYHAADGLEYSYWFDVVRVPPKSNVEILANYRLDVTPQGEKMLAAKGLTSVFPAIIRTDSPYHTYYFAGDYADYNNSPKFYCSVPWRQYLAIHGINPADDFFWSVYFPLIKQIMSETASRQ